MGRPKRKKSLALMQPAVPSGSVSAVLPAPASSRWILDWWRDLLLFVATPLLIVPLFLAVQAKWSAEEIYLFVASFGALGHHLPGMMRAYGDKALLSRFRARFVAAPLFLGTVCILFTQWEMSGVLLISYLWGVWHAQMQTYGFLRIYDAKVVSFAPWMSRLDYAMCLAWFGAAVVLSPSRVGKILALFYNCGGPILPGTAVSALASLWTWATGAVTLVFIAYLSWAWRRNRRPSWVKLTLMVTSFGFWWYSNVTVSNLLLGIALFEVFHDFQYLSIVWVFNRNRVRKGEGVSSFTRFLFRKSGVLVGMYVGLVFAYGSLFFVARGLSSESLKAGLTGLLAASGLLHFYYDGFIWKVRERATRESLGLAGGKSESGSSRSLPQGLSHGLKWAVFVVPLVWLGATEVRGRAPEIERARAVVAAVPEDAQGHYNLGVALDEQGRTAEAIAQFREAVRIQPSDAKTHNNLGAALARQGNVREAMSHYSEALRLNPNDAKAHNNLGGALAGEGNLDAAIEHFREALRILPDYPMARQNLEMALRQRGMIPSP